MDFKLLHTADIHLGVPLNSFGPKKGEDQRKQIKKTFEKIIDKAIDEKYAGILIAGDLFNSNNPAYETILFVKSQMKKLNDAGVLCFILPGTHDCLSKNSIYLRENFNAGLENIYIFNNPDINNFKIEDLDLTVWGKPNVKNQSEESPLIKKEKFKTKINILLAHGSFQIEGKSSSGDYPITKEDIIMTDMNYIALGHWHGAQDYSTGSVAVWYSGSPEIIDFESKGGLGSGHIMEIIFGKGRLTEATPVKFSERQIMDIDINISEAGDQSEIIHQISKNADKNTILKVLLTGIQKEDFYLQTEIIQEQLEDAFFLIKISDKSVMPANNGLENYPEQTAISQFITVADKRISDAKNKEETEIFKKAKELGMALLNQKDVL